ncbi:MAG TPA: hypothetical protein VFT59_01340 [Candidatus Saccharimonadales bacterium]|nr:hypothetical protein [Candidatus Saccharimonadales bacterium]
MRNVNEHCITELQFQIEDTTGEGLTYNYEGVIWGIEACRNLLSKGNSVVNNMFQVTSANEVHYWSVRCQGTLFELNRKTLLRIFHTTIQQLIEGHPPQYRIDDCWGTLSCVVGKVYERHISDEARDVDFFMRLMVPVWTHGSDFTAFLRGLEWQADQLNSSVECTEGPLVFYATVKGLSSGRRDTLMSDFIKKVIGLHFR